MDVDIAGVRNLTLSTSIKKPLKGVYTLFWGEAVLCWRTEGKFQLPGLPVKKRNGKFFWLRQGLPLEDVSI